jgi:CDP-diacylglycerol pyrophosphatase
VKPLKAIAVTLAATLGAGAVLAPRLADASNPNALWHVVHDLCRVDMKISHDAAPCLMYDGKRGVAALKDLRGQTQILLIPTTRVTGIESQKLLAPDGPNYWQAAWNARVYFERRAKNAAPREDIGMAINSTYGRSQNQLHIHIDCVRADVKAALSAHASAIGRRWAVLNADLAGSRYRARRIDGAEIAPHDPFKLLAQESPTVRGAMGAQTLAVIPMRFAKGKLGFALLASTGGTAANPDGSSEDLLDHECKVLKSPA